MKKFYIVLFNIIVLVFIYFGFEYCLYLKSDDEKPFFYSVKSIKSQDWDEFYKTAHFKEPIFRNKDLKPIVLFGCSFAFGFGIDDEQTFSYKLSKYTNRTVYNRGLCGGGIQHVLYQLRREDFYKEIPEPEYVIYLYISNHIRRMYKYAYNDVVLGGEYNYLKYNKIFDEL